ncbi:MAG TPA: 4-hydroxybenzoate octaprenyltransferase [Burkholderiales bacterium]|nr:4-hydroxybenzoate octaprenyltransferase [Burkholderiales bacterium]
MSLSAVRRRLDLYEKLLRLDKPIGTLLLLWPTLWALWLSANGRPNWKIVWIFALGTLLMRSAGVAMNDFADRNFDPHVARTRDRPLAAGSVSAKEAWVLAAALALIAFLLILPLGRLVILLSVCALFLAVTYPFTKRFLALPQAYLGVAFGFGIPMAYAAQTRGLPAITWVLLLANIFWTIAYDTEYAMVDRDDDRKIGIRTSAILFGRHDVAAVILCHAAFLGVAAGIGWWLNLAWPYYAGLLCALALAIYQYALIRNRDPQRCLRAFRDNNWVGAVVFAGIVLAYLLPRAG